MYGAAVCTDNTYIPFLNCSFSNLFVTFSAHPTTCAIISIVYALQEAFYAWHLQSQMFTKRNLIMTHHNSAVTHGSPQFKTVCRLLHSVCLYEQTHSGGQLYHTPEKAQNVSEKCVFSRRNILLFCFSASKSSILVYDCITAVRFTLHL